MKRVYLDTEGTNLDGLGELYEIATIVREPGLPDRDYWWQIRPSMVDANPTSLRIGHYYERAKVLDCEIGQGIQLATVECGGIRQGDVLQVMGGDAIALEVAKELDGAVIVANNPRHDRDYLWKFLLAHGQAFTASHRMDDIRPMMTGYVCGRLSAHEGKVDEAFGSEAAPYVQDWIDGATDVLAWEILGIHQPRETRHTALGDARLVRDVHDAIRAGAHR